MNYDQLWFVTCDVIAFQSLQNISTFHTAASISDQATGFFDLPNPSSRILALGSNQPLTESTRNLCLGEGRERQPAGALYQQLREWQR
jgi:hypothetical protein